MKDLKTLRLEAKVPADHAEIAQYLLISHGSGAAVEKQEKNGKDVTVLAHFDPDEKSEDSLRIEMTRAFDAFPGLRGAEITVEREQVRDYDELCKQHFAPFEIAKGIVVVPSWEKYEPRPGDRVIELDPGMAFGTGLHETTRLCAEAIESCARDSRSMLDTGTGSGILAIEARLLGVKRICAVENDPDAREAARENFRKNSCADVEIIEDIGEAPGPFDLVVANILLSTLLDLRNVLAKLVSKRGTLVLSGITHDQEGEITAAYSGEFKGCETRRRGEWSTIIFRRQ